MDMILIPLQSGSAGNCLYVESGGVRLLFDAGVSGSQVKDRLAAAAVDVASVDGLFITHEHADHIKCAGILGRKFKIPVHITEPTYRRGLRRMGLEGIPDLRHFRSGSSVRIGHVTVESVRTPHDAVDGVVFVIDDGHHRLGICTDIGHVFAAMHDIVSSVDGLFLESNYDQAMLEGGSYPWTLKKRISGPGGHISNLESAELVAAAAGGRLQWLYAGHLSQENNRPELVMRTHREVLGDRLPILIAQRYAPSPRAELSSSVPGGKAFPARYQAPVTAVQPELFPGF